jgi:hypothetical protein
MPIAIGVPCIDGVVFASDHQYSAGTVRTAGAKSSPNRLVAPDSQNSVWVAATGNPESGKKAAKNVFGALSRSFTLDEFVASTEGSLKEYLNLYYYSVPEEEREDLFCELLFAVRSGQFCALYRANGPMIVRQQSPVCVGEGSEVGSYLLNLLLPTASVSVEVASQVVAHVVSVTADCVSSPGKGVSLHVMRSDGVHSSLLKAQRHVIENHFEELLRSMSELIACCDSETRSEDHVSAQLDSLRQSIEGLREAHAKRLALRRKLVLAAASGQSAFPAAAASIP